MRHDQTFFARSTTVKATWLKPLCLLAACLAFQLPAQAQAQAAPEVTPSLQKLLHALPIPGIEDELKGMLDALQKTSCGGNFTGCYMTQSGSLQLYFFTSGRAQETLLLVVDKSMSMPKLLTGPVQKVIGDTSLRSPIFSLSTTDYELNQNQMPPALQQVVKDKYFNINTLTFSSGVQLAARANLGGPIKLAMEAMGVRGNQLMLRAAVVMPIPTDLAGGAGAGAATADAVAHGETMTKAGADALSPEAFVEIQFAPNASLAFGMPQMTLTDATFFVNNALTFGYKGNAAYKGAENKKVIMQFKTPLDPAGAMDLLDFSFHMATPAGFTMKDAAHVMVAMATPDPRLSKYGGGFIRNIESFKNPLLAMTKPLSVIQLRNPNPPPEYRFGDSRKPFPTDEKYFNLAVLGPLADGGPLLNAAGDVTILGQRMGWLAASAGQSGLRGDVGEAVTLKLGPLGNVSFRMQATMAINADRQDINLLGNFDGQKVEVGLSGSTMKVEVSASCVNPFEIKTQLEIQASTNIADVFEGKGGVNVDPSKIGGCIGKELEAAYNKIAKEFSHLGGYTASAANAALNEINNVANVAVNEVTNIGNTVANIGEDSYNQAKEEARKAAEASLKAGREAWKGGTNALMGAVTTVSNAVTGGGIQTIEKWDTTNMTFDLSVFDWDYYYDTFDMDRYNQKGLTFTVPRNQNNPFGKPKDNSEVVAEKDKSEIDLVQHWVNTGYPNSWRGSLEFDPAFYAQTYPDAVQYSRSATDVMGDWIYNGIKKGRMGSADFDVKSYLARHEDLRRAFGDYGYEQALVHWLTIGKTNEHRDGRPFAAALLTTGMNGGSAWDDYRFCQGQHVTGFAVRSEGKVDGLAFLYANGAWGPPQGRLGSPPYTEEVHLAAGEYIVRVDYTGNDVNSLKFITNTNRTFGPYGNAKDGTPGTYNVTPGQKLGCMQGRSGRRIDQLTFSSTVPQQ